MPAEGATHRDSHELRDLAPVAVGEDAWVMPHGVLADTPSGRTRHPRGCPRRIPSRGGANAEFVDVETWKVRWMDAVFCVTSWWIYFGLLMHSWSAHFSYVLTILHQHLPLLPLRFSVFSSTPVPEVVFVLT